MSPVAVRLVGEVAVVGVGMPVTVAAPSDLTSVTSVPLNVLRFRLTCSWRSRLPRRSSRLVSRRSARAPSRSRFTFCSSVTCRADVGMSTMARIPDAFQDMWCLHNCTSCILRAQSVHVMTCMTQSDNIISNTRGMHFGAVNVPIRNSLQAASVNDEAAARPTTFTTVRVKARGQDSRK
jgi:hypothetical protein